MSTVAAIFGSRSVEHEVSVITAQQAMAALSPSHQAVPVYIAKDGRWYTGDPLTQLDRFADVDRLLAACTAVTPVIDASRPRLALVPIAHARRGIFGRGTGDRQHIEEALGVSIERHAARPNRPVPA